MKGRYVQLTLRHPRMNLADVEEALHAMMSALGHPASVRLHVSPLHGYHSLRHGFRLTLCTDEEN